MEVIAYWYKNVRFSSLGNHNAYSNVIEEGVIKRSVVGVGIFCEKIIQRQELKQRRSPNCSGCM